jgi:hypothetical protein
MEIYLKFAENKAIGKRQGLQEESPCEKESNLKAARLRRAFSPQPRSCL